MPKKPNGYSKFGVYVFADQDPMIRVLHTIKTSQKVSDAEIRRRAHENIATSTMGNWWGKKTKKPQLATIANVSLALGLTSIPLTNEGRKELIDLHKNS